MSSWELTSRGVPPGSVLGPLLFNVFLNDLAHFVIGAHLNAYADDQKLYYSDTDHLALLTQLNNELSVAVDWLKHNGLSYDPGMVESRSFFIMRQRCFPHIGSNVLIFTQRMHKPT